MQTYNQLLHKPTTYVCSKRVFRRCKIEWWEKNTRWPVIGIDGWCVQSKAFANALLLLNVGLALCPRLHSPVWAFGLSLRGGILPYWAFSTGSNYVISTRHFKNPIALELCNTFSSLIRLTPQCWELKKGQLLWILKYKSWMRDFFRKSLPGKNTNLMRKVVVDDRQLRSPGISISRIMDVLQITARSFGSSFDRFSVGNLLSGGIELIARHIYFADTNLTIFSKISFHYSHVRSPPDWQQKDCPKTVFARRKKFRMFFCFGFAAPAAYRALCQSCLPHSSYKTTRFCNHFVNITSSSSDPTFREKELESLKGTNCCIAILALDQEFIWWLDTLSERLQFDLEGFPGGHRTTL